MYMLMSLEHLCKKLLFKHSIGREIAGLWVGTWNDESREGMQRAEEALDLIKNNDPVQFAHVTGHLKRIWVSLLSGNRAQYNRSIDACVLDERFVRSEETTIAEIAATIIHEATHARLEHWGIRYDEGRRSRIEAICHRRAIAFANRLPDCENLRAKLVYELEWFIAHAGQFSNKSFSERRLKGSVEALRYLKTPDWLIKTLLTLRKARAENYAGKAP